MINRTRRLLSSLGVLALGGVLTLSPLAANATTSTVQARIDEVIAQYGGTQTAANEVTWDNGAVILTVESSSGVQPLSIGSCPTGDYCAYSLAGYLGSRLTFTTCTTGNSVAALGGPVRSIANSRSSGTVRAYNGSTLVLSVSPNTGTNTTATISTLSCS